ncbi:MAG: VTC domain-containing protein [Breznakia sp.]
MHKEIFNRHEAKFVLSKDTFIKFQQDLLAYVTADIHNENQQSYRIYSIYFDTKQHDFIRHSLSKPRYKEKLRIRSYQPLSENTYVYVEIKKKYCGFTNKRRTKMTYQEALHLLLLKQVIEYKEYMNKQVIKEILHILKNNDVYPMSFLHYDRLAYQGKDDKHVRITFDCNITSKRDTTYYSLLNHEKYLMEIKVEEAFPLWLSTLLSKYQIYRSSFSKYGKDYILFLSQNICTYTT